MPRSFDPNDPETYFADPRTRKWLVRCTGCGRVGFRADAPAEFFNRYWAEQKLEALDRDDRGRCQVCRAADAQTRPGSD